MWRVSQAPSSLSTPVSDIAASSQAQIYEVLEKIVVKSYKRLAGPRSGSQKYMAYAKLTKL